MCLELLQVEHQDMEAISEEIDDHENEVQIVSGSLQDPSHVKQTSEHESRDNKEFSIEAAYAAWMVKHPSALNRFDQMMSTVMKKKIVVFLDYDGTLSPIVDDPNRAFMSDSMRSILKEVAQYFPTCIISGRSREKVYEFVRLSNVYYVGSHGLDIMAPNKSLNDANITFHEKTIDEKGNEVILYQPAQKYSPKIEKMFKELEEKTKEIQGAMIENNKFCISVHFRRVNKENWSVLEEQVMAITKKYSDFHITRGRKVVEIRPSIEWDKGKALEYLLDNLGFGSNGTAFPLYIGDDRTDEDAFKVLQSRGQGYPIVVSSIPKDTKASYSLRDPSDVSSFLLRLSRWKINSLDRLVS
ncbi:probable trehalose-phosphate phosphatase C [Elaeis guineensis]|uniref:Trehalose 6-phosphate phosphatase n=1 Tax=Elaeis guineensis var. tenera TaxID=51953 RepID=A0A6J0PGI6_ELAGV|nr:probable trehalose-phosphate phosphatase 4 [Elaeis guineensis]